MQTTPVRRLRPRGRIAVLLAVGLALVLLSAPAFAVEFGKGKKVRGSWDTTVSFGVSWRLDDQDPDLIGLDNGGKAYSLNGDDGNLNYDSGLFSMVPKITTELELNIGDHFGFFVRGSAFYDWENEENDRARTPLSDEALERVGSRAELLDAYIYTSFNIGKNPAQLRLGYQVLSWGESTFIQGGINTINPVDVAAIRVPGAELREALLPVGMIWGNFALSKNWNVEAFYQFDWLKVKIDPPGTYFSTNDFAGAGGDTVFLGFGSMVSINPDNPGGDLPPYFSPLSPPFFESSRPFLGVPRTADVEPEEGGQYGLKLTWFVPALGNTEFGLYFINYHSRLPTINGRTGILTDDPAGANVGQLAAFGAGAATLAALQYLALNPGDPTGAIATGTNAGVANGASAARAGTTATLVVNTALQGGDAASLGSAIATDAYAQTARYFTAYPEDIKLYGLSFNTQIGTSGIALQGELSYRQDVPMQVDDVELLFAALGPISTTFAGLGDPEGMSQLVSYADLDFSACFISPGSPDCPLETNLDGFILLDSWQFQTTATKIFGPGLGADQSVLLAEIGVNHVPDLPDKSVLRMEAPGTYTSGNPYHENPATAPGQTRAHVGKPAEDAEYFADKTSWGYRLITRLDYLNAIGAWSLSPRLAWGHDVSGNTPGPGGSFLDGRTALTIGLATAYQNTWQADLSYTRFDGAGRHNLISDRDFIAANVKYSF